MKSLTDLVASPVLQAHALLGEGPVWDGARSVLYWVDIHKNALHTFDPASGKDSAVDLGENIGCLVKRKEKAGSAAPSFIVGLPEKFATVDGGKVTPIARPEEGLGNRMNDGKCDPAGRFWCGSMHPDFAPGVGNLWMMDGDYKVTKKLSGVTISNGLAWSGDNRTMYYIDTPTGHIDAFDFDIATGDIKNRRVAVQNTWGGHFDGMTIDTDDNLYVAIWSGGCVLKLDPGSGKLLAKIVVPGVQNTTCPIFGGKDLDELYITSSGEGADPAKEPNAGALFHIKLPGVTGRAAVDFAG